MSSGWFSWRKIGLACSILLLVCLAGFFWIRHELHHLSFRFSASSSNELVPFKAAIANVTVVKRPGTPTLLTKPSTYGNTELQADAKLFDAWQSAVELGDSTLRHTESGDWVKSSLGADFVPSEKRLDPWNHAFCLLRRDDALVVISAGPSAPSSPTCKNIQIDTKELTQLPRKRLLQSPDGYLVLSLTSNNR